MSGDMGWYVSKTEGYDSPEAVLFDCDDGEERLSHTDPEEAIVDSLDKWLDPGPGCDVLAVLREKVGETIKVYAFRRMPMRGPDPRYVLDWIYEDLSEEYSDPDGDDNGPTAEINAAAEALCDLIRKEYDVWPCEVCGSAEVNVEAFVRDVRPDWLEEPASSGEGE